MGKTEAKLGEILTLLEKKKQNTALSTLPILSLLVLSACGGSSEGEVDPGTTPITPAPDPDPVVPVPYSGSVIKGPLENALVFLDYDGDGVLGADEPSVRTNADGSFEVDGNVEGVGFVAQTDSTTVDTSSGEVLDNVVLKAPSGSSVVTPATTIMQEAGITKEEVSAVLGLPEGVDVTSFNPYSADADPEVALAVEKVSQQVMTTITAVSSAVEGAGASSAAAFAVALETVVEVVKEKAAVVKENPAAVVEVLDLSKTEEIAAVTQKVSAKIEEQGIATKEDFETVKADLNVAVTNVNTKIDEVTDLTSEDSMAAFAVATELKEQVKAAVESKGDPATAIKFTDAAEIEKVQEEKAEEIKEKIDSGEPKVIEASAIAGTNVLKLAVDTAIFGNPNTSDFFVKVDGYQTIVENIKLSEDGKEIILTLGDFILNGQSLEYSYSKSVLTNNQLVAQGSSSTLESFNSRNAFVMDDNISPILEISSKIIDQDTIIEFSFSKEPINFDILDVIVIDGELSSFSQESGFPNVYLAKFTPKILSEGSALLSVEPYSYSDRAGNSGEYTASFSLKFDTKPPTKPEILNNFVDNRTVDTAPTILGRAEPLSILEVFDDGGLLGKTITNQDGSWSFTPDTALTIGVSDFTVRATDKFGNVSEISDILSVRIDEESSEKFIDGINGYLRINNISISEHQNGAYLGELEWVYDNELNANVVYSIYDGYDFLELDGSKLYLKDGYHFDYESIVNPDANTFTITKYNPVSYTNGAGQLSWTGWNTSSAVIKVDSSSNYKTTIDVWDKFELPFDDIVESISLTPENFDPYLTGATLGQLISTLETYSFGLTDTNIFEISQSQLKLKDNIYYDLQLNEFVNKADGTFYEIGNEDTLGIISYQTSAKDINFIDNINISDLLEGVQNSAIPYFAGTPVLQKPLSGKADIDALLSVSNDAEASVLFWDNNKNYSSESGKNYNYL